MQEQLLATVAAEYLGGVATLGCEVRSDADFAKVVEAGLPPDALSTLTKCGVSEKEITTLIINPRTLSHRRAKGQRLSVDESDRAARVARVVALAERTFANRDKANRWLRLELHILSDRRPIDLIRTQAGARLVEAELARDCLGHSSLMRLWRLSAATHADRFDGGYGFTNDGRWNFRGHPVTYCSTGPALCVLERLVHIQDAALLPDDTMLVSLDVPDGISVDVVQLTSLPTDWRSDQRTTRLRGDTWLRARSACLLSLPSAVVPVADSNARNILINHLHPDVNDIAITRVEAFEYDTRLFAFG